MDFSHLLQTLAAAQGRDAWVAVSSGTGETAQTAVLHGSLREIGLSEDVAFLPVEIAGEPNLSERIGITLDPAGFEAAEGTLPGDLFVKLRDTNVRVATR